jgi:hypothetical protein
MKPYSSVDSSCKAISFSETFAARSTHYTAETKYPLHWEAQISAQLGPIDNGSPYPISETLFQIKTGWRTMARNTICISITLSQTFSPFLASLQFMWSLFADVQERTHDSSHSNL